MYKYIKAIQTILGRNERNLYYTLPENSKEARLIADCKLMTKRVVRKSDIPVPFTYNIIRTKEKLDDFDWESLPSSFVLKPNRGRRGKGIVITYGEKKRKDKGEAREWIKADGTRIAKDFLYNHIQEILEGEYSLRNGADRAFFEERVKNIPELKPYLYKGVPDIRILVYNKIPIMAELRLPTKESNGKANLHAGGVGVGIDIASGITTIAIHNDKLIKIHPDTKMNLSGFSIPYWDKILEIAIKAHIETKLGYAGVDIAIDKVKGPLLLEVNARPGLAIQIANNDGLKERLKRIRKLKVKTIKRAIRIAKELFGGEVEEEVETILGKKIIGLKTKIKLKGKNSIEELIEAKIDTGAVYSSIDKELAMKLGFNEAVKYFESFNLPKSISREEAKAFYKENEFRILDTNKDIISLGTIKSSSGTTIRPIIEIETLIEGQSQKTKFTVIDRQSLKYSAIIGSRDLSPFIINPTQGI